MAKKNSPKKKAYNQQYTAERAASKVAQGLCKRCGIRPLHTRYLCKECREDENIKQNARWQAIRRDVLDHYGAPYCACCHEKFDYEFLTLDHIAGGGNEHRRQLSGNGTPNAGTKVYRWIKRNNYPPGFQPLCWNCNMTKRDNKECPHIQAQLTLLTKLAAMPLTY